MLNSHALVLKRLFLAMIFSFSLATVYLSPLFTTSVRAADSGYKIPSAMHAPNQWDVNSVSNVQASDDAYAIDNDNGDVQGYSHFNFPVIPAGSTIDGVEVFIEMSSNDIDCVWGVGISWDNGANYTAYQPISVYTIDQGFTIGGAAETFGRVWSAEEFSNSNFVVRLLSTHTAPNCQIDTEVRVDLLQAKVYFTPQSVGGLTVNGQLDTEGNGSFDGGNPESASAGILWGIGAEAPARAMGSSESGLAVGEYGITQNSAVGYEFVGWFISGDFSCDNPEGTVLPAVVSVAADQVAEITLCNRIIVVEPEIGAIQTKLQVDSGSGYQAVGAGQGYSWGLDAEPTATRDIDTTQSGLDTGGHTVFIVGATANYQFTGWFVGQGSCEGENSSSSPASVNVANDQTTIVTFCGLIEEVVDAPDDPVETPVTTTTPPAVNTAVAISPPKVLAAAATLADTGSPLALQYSISPILMALSMLLKAKNRPNRRKNLPPSAVYPPEPDPDRGSRSASTATARLRWF